MKIRSGNGSSVSRLQTCLVLLLTAFGVFGQEPLVAGRLDAHTTHCTMFIPPDAVPLENLHLCTSSHRGHTEVFACQNMVVGSVRYLIYFKGGHRPKAIARLNESDQVTQLLWQESFNTPAPDCQLQAPPHFSAGAQFQGAGVCQDENDRQVPCSVFRVKVPRMKTYTDYLTFYSPDGSGPETSRKLYTGINQDAIPAELMFQIGLSLSKTRCCRQSGWQYIEQAHRLFPASKLYRAVSK